MQTSLSQTRRFPRVPAVRPVLVRLPNGDSQPYEEIARTRVLGLGGMMFVGGKLLGEGAALELLISLREGVVRAGGGVVWESRRSVGEVEIGVEFLRLDETDRERLASLVARGGIDPPPMPI